MPRNLRRILELDPEADHGEILRITAGLDFPWDYVRALEFALFRTYCVPSISRLLSETGEFRRHPQKRYDDTALLMGELLEHGYDSARGRTALRSVNRMHGQYAISNDDMRYVLSTFIYDPIAWITAHGWRTLSAHERAAAFHFYRAVGTRMGIRDLPASYDEYAAFKEAYEEQHFVYSPTNREIGQYTLDLFCSWYPYVPRSWTARAAVSLLDDRMIAAFGFTPAPAWLGRLARAGLRFRSLIVRALPPRRRLKLTSAPNRSYPGYPEGYSVDDLGAISSTARFPSN
ncbi:DUF2236 domain-containing protein [Lentzea tibetensis]|uniref:DUF2236 domain-containing protein n=1 Tax=Lentzea tibetensis TaxID=2591470 RepID=A0A563EH36_9PSEU|nr:oxygenase MpaB family protein [Lentzea tibetensis]TWP45811.1 DUF2236 domain-containing protein [Lentzea tibetensis]